MIFEKPRFKVGVLVGDEDRVIGEVAGFSTTMRERKTGRALVRVKTHKGKYPPQLFKDSELLSVVVGPIDG